MRNPSANRVGRLRKYLSPVTRPPALLSMLVLSLLVFPASIQAATVPPLGTAANFAVLGASTVTNTGPTVVNGDLGLFPGTSVTGFGPGIVNGTMHITDAVANTAQTDAMTAYTNAAGQSCDVDLTSIDLGSLTLTPGVYCFSSSAQLTGTLTLDFQGDPNAVFIFQIGSTLTTASNSSVVVINGSPSCNNIFFQVGSSATVGTGTQFLGDILALVSITVTTGAVIDGSLYGLTGAVTLDTNVISLLQGCVLPQPTATGPTPTPTGPTPTATGPTPTATGPTPMATPTCAICGPCGQPCRADCTFCGDGIVQPGETCDDGNCAECDPNFPQKPVAGDSCNNQCAGLICKDPSKIRLTTRPALDLFKSHGVIVPLAGSPIDFSSGNVTISLTTAQTLIFENSVSSAVSVLTNGGFKYKNRDAKQAGGIYQLKASPTSIGTFKLTIISYGDLTQATADMVTHITVAGTEWTVHGLWRQTARGWVFERTF
jgi:Ice-binding-like